MLQQTVWYTLADTDIGSILIAATKQGVCFIGLGSSEAECIAAMETKCPQCRFVHNDHHDVGDRQGEGKGSSRHAQLQTWKQALIGYCQGTLGHPTIPLDITGTPFQQQVWEALQTIPYGDTCSYAAIAQSINNPQAVRAVGAACGANPVPLVIPCHRVIASDGGLGGYGGGLERKKLLLELEQRNKSRFAACSSPVHG